MNQRRKIDYFIIWLKGIAMGAADVVPGVSGGTIAFISGIYEELLTAISSVNLALIKELKTKGIAYVWKKINGSFLLALLVGIFTSVVSLSKGLSWLLKHQPVLLWSFFFGLVVASIFYIAKQIEKWNVKSIILIVIATILAYYISDSEPLVTSESSYFYLFFSGALAICAMILPGISGAFILVLLGAYEPVLNAIHQRNIPVILVVGAGAIVGLLTFSKVLKWLFVHYKNGTLVFLLGFIIGSLNKIWPWKKVVKTTFIEGKEIILKSESVLPFSYDKSPQLVWAICLAITGFALILLLEKWANFTKK